ncbi:MAG: aspartate kinase, monofunctional class [Chloroflexi bacterium]|nr:aspartate kinase, monofunctional class [Chloroflexota bacterium]
MLVMKFGGTSVGQTQAFSQVTEIIARARQQDTHVVVVTSAMKGTTNTLIEAAQAAAAGHEQPYHAARSELLLKHQLVAGQLIADGVERAAYGRLIDDLLRSFERLCQSIYVLGELTTRGLDVVSGLGERMSAPLLAAVLRAAGVDAVWVDAADMIVTDAHFGDATPLMEATCAHVNARLRPLLDQGQVAVVTGFVAATADGIATTLGRGGTDYSAAILGACLGADEVQIWTDVNGILTTDPRVVSEARTLPELSYVEAAELAYFGAKVLHPKTILPVVEASIPIRVANTFDPEGPSTLVLPEREVVGSVKAITAIHDLTLVNVEGRGMIGVPGIAARTFKAVAEVGANVLMISQASSEQSICFSVPERNAAAVVSALEQELELELRRHFIDRVRVQEHIVIIAMVGAGMRGTPGIAGRIFSTLGAAGINVIAVAQGSSEVNISLVVSEEDAAEAVRRIHAAFFELPTPQTSDLPLSP